MKKGWMAVVVVLVVLAVFGVSAGKDSDCVADCQDQRNECRAGCVEGDGDPGPCFGGCGAAYSRCVQRCN